MFWKWSKKKEQVYHVGNEDVAVPEVHTGKVAHEQAAQQDTGEKENIHLSLIHISEPAVHQNYSLLFIHYYLSVRCSLPAIGACVPASGQRQWRFRDCVS